jgi:hypothetical protein
MSIDLARTFSVAALAIAASAAFAQTDEAGDNCFPVAAEVASPEIAVSLRELQSELARCGSRCSGEVRECGAWDASTAMSSTGSTTI